MVAPFLSSGWWGCTGWWGGGSDRWLRRTDRSEACTLGRVGAKAGQDLGDPGLADAEGVGGVPLGVTVREEGEQATLPR